MSYIKRLFVDRIIDLYDNGEKPEHIAKIYLYQKKMCELLQMNLNDNEMRES